VVFFLSRLLGRASFSSLSRWMLLANDGDVKMHLKAYSTQMSVMLRCEALPHLKHECAPEQPLFKISCVAFIFCI
jgi:hypothetical protein